MYINQYDIGRRGCALMSSLLKANWDRRADGQAGTSKYRDACASKNTYPNKITNQNKYKQQEKPRFGSF